MVHVKNKTKQKIYMCVYIYMYIRNHLVKWARGGERAVVSASPVLQLGNRIAKRFWLKGQRSEFFSCISLTCSSASFPLHGSRDPAQLTCLVS